MTGTKKKKTSQKIDISDKEAFLSSRRREQFYPFVVQAFEDTHRTEMESREFVRYVCNKIEPCAKQVRGKMLVNTPPKNMKTFIVICCLAAWMLGRQPYLEILIVAGNEGLAASIVRSIRKIMTGRGYIRTFATRLKNTPTKTYLETTEGGIATVVTIGEKFTGASADAVLVDDLVDIADAGNQRVLSQVNSNYDQKILSRRKLGVRSLAVVVAHRLAKNDLSGHLLAKGGWEHICMPFEAETDQIYLAGGFRWHRKKGDRLRPDAYDDTELAGYLANKLPPGFQALFQQRPEGPAFVKLDSACIRRFAGTLPTGPRVISVDTAQSNHSDADFSEIQVWTYSRGIHILLDEVHERLDPEALAQVLKKKCRIHRPAEVLIEDNGPVAMLARKVKNLAPLKIIGVKNISKVERLLPHIDLIRSGGIQISPTLPKSDEFILEVTGFPDCRYDDRVDAMTQYLTYYNDVGGIIAQVPECAVVARGLGTRVNIKFDRGMKVQSYRNIAVLRNSNWW